jgi:hypothetical protein
MRISNRKGIKEESNNSKADLPKREVTAAINSNPMKQKIPTKAETIAA